MATKATRSILIRGVVEATEGTDPGSGYSDILADPGAIAVASETSTPRNVVTDSFSKLSPALSQQAWALPISVEMGGGGVATPPPADWLYRSAGLKRTDAYVITGDAATGTFNVGEQVVNTTQSSENCGKVVAASATEIILYDGENVPIDDDVLTGVDSSATITVNVTVAEGYAYRPTSTRSELESVTCHAYLGGSTGIRKIMTGARSTCSFAIGVGPKPSATFSLQGVYNAPTDTAAPASSFSTVIAPNGHGGTSVFGSTTLTGIAKQNLTIDLGNSITPRPDLDASDALVGFELSDRTVTATWDPEIHELSTLNPYSLKDAQTQTQLQYRWGSTAGNRLLVDLPGAVISAVAEVDRDGIAAYNLSFNPEAVNSVADSEVALVIY